MAGIKADYKLYSIDYERNRTILSNKQVTFGPPLDKVMNTLRYIMDADGFNRKLGGKLTALRNEMKLHDEAAAIMKSAGMSGFSSDPRGKLKLTRVSERQFWAAAAIKSLRHVYMQRVWGGKEVWIVSTPRRYKNYIWSELNRAGRDPLNQYAKLTSRTEIFSEQQKKQLADSTLWAQTWVHKTLIELNKAAANPKAQAYQKVRDWFSGAWAPKEKVEADIITIAGKLAKIRNLINTNKLIFTDMPSLRRTHEHDKTLAFVFANMYEKIPIIYIEKAFFYKAKMVTDNVNWANTIIHEITHLALNTKDHKYDFQGLSPDIHLTPAQALDNADNWGLFCADVCGELTDTQRANILYGRGMPPPVPPKKLKVSSF